MRGGNFLSSCLASMFMRPLDYPLTTVVVATKVLVMMPLILSLLLSAAPGTVAHPWHAYVQDPATGKPFSKWEFYGTDAKEKCEEYISIWQKGGKEETGLTYWCERS